MAYSINKGARIIESSILRFDGTIIISWNECLL